MKQRSVCTSRVMLTLTITGIALTSNVGCTSGPPSGNGPGTGGGAAGVGSGGAGGSSGPAGSGGGTGSGGSTGAGGAAGSSDAGSGGAAASGGGAGSGGRAGAGGVPGVGGAAGLGGAAGAGGSDNRLVPAQGALLGLYYGDGTVTSTEMLIGRKAAVHLVYYAWADDWTGGARSDLNGGRIPLVNWEPSAPNLTDIVGGVYDAMLHQRAQSAKALGGRLFLDWGAEMNGNWSAWSGANYGNSAATYVAAYRHIHDLFVGDGATNVVWAWCPNVTDEPNAAWNQTMNYYPGDAYVDWTCVDGYNWGSTNGGGWQSFQTVFANVYPKLAAKGKPIMIGEMASTELGGDKAQWIDGILPAMRAQFPLFRALVWFDVNKETDWRVNSSTSSLSAFNRMANDPYFNP